MLCIDGLVRVYLGMNVIGLRVGRVRHPKCGDDLDGELADSDWCLVHPCAHLNLGRKHVGVAGSHGSPERLRCSITDEVCGHVRRA
jgi:hypothetical protein